MQQLCGARPARSMAETTRKRRAARNIVAFRRAPGGADRASRSVVWFGVAGPRAARGASGNWGARPATCGRSTRPLPEETAPGEGLNQLPRGWTKPTQPATALANAAHHCAAAVCAHTELRRAAGSEHGPARVMPHGATVRRARGPAPCLAASSRVAPELSARGTCVASRRIRRRVGAALAGHRFRFESRTRVTAEEFLLRGAYESPTTRSVHAARRHVTVRNGLHEVARSSRSKTTVNS